VLHDERRLLGVHDEALDRLRRHNDTSGTGTGPAPNDKRSAHDTSGTGSRLQQ
jgi:hypothetical protein